MEQNVLLSIGRVWLDGYLPVHLERARHPKMSQKSKLKCHLSNAAKRKSNNKLNN